MDVSRSFSRIITSSLNHNIRLMLPTFFVNDWRQKFGDTIEVTAYDGIIVTIKLERVDGKIYLADGWEQFFDYHNLQNGYVLVFEYNDNVTLNMTIFDHFGLEVTYDSDEESQEGNISDNSIFEIILTPRFNSHMKIEIKVSVHGDLVSLHARRQVFVHGDYESPCTES
ncbi:B3 domain-containing transcription factor VRN1-like [Olea europaea var. sylvestris]|uniref:B3 domain-containing transcription factor VRN1-like n=1 Tax=Olea europaea var. sylvestris TaxID=158386 RepID=UPI000C1CDFEB|nr:B3 domain-containing transcription factor VRN1-like [Olea europaea var. sylvestris]